MKTLQYQFLEKLQRVVKKGQVRRMLSLTIKFIPAIKTAVSPCFCITVLHGSSPAHHCLQVDTNNEFLILLTVQVNSS